MKNNKRSYETAWLCNGKNPLCKDQYGCFYHIENGLRGSCSHTRDPKYSLHKPARSVKDNPEWFDRFSSEAGTRYYERETAK